MFDGGVPQVFARSLGAAGVEVERFPKTWKGLQNGCLLARLEAEGIECLVTCDENLPFQQTIGTRPFCVLVLPATKLALLEPLAASVGDALHQLTPGQVERLHLDGRLSIL